MTASRQSLLAVLAIAVAAAAVYLPSLGGEFLWDDDTFLTDNELIRAADGLQRFWFTTEPIDYFPLVESSLWVEWRLWGMNPLGYRVVNLLLHAASAVLVYLVLRALRVPGAPLGGLLFAVHPVNVESVAWITQRKNTLPMALYLGSMLAYLVWDEKRRRGLYGAALALFAAAMLGKSSVAMLPLALIGLVWWRRRRVGRGDVRALLPFAVVSAVVSAVTVWFQYARSIKGVEVRTDPLLSRLLLAGKGFWFYLGKAVAPVGLSFVYPRWREASPSVASCLPVAALAMLFAVLWRRRRGWGAGPLTAFWYFAVSLVPVAGFVNIFFMRYSYVSDHWQYVAIPGITGLIGGYGGWLWRRGGRLRGVAAVAGAALVAIFGSQAWRRAHVFTASETLWRDTLARNPDAWIASSNLGLLLYERGDAERARSLFLEALRANPESGEALYNMALVATFLGSDGEAESYQRKAAGITPPSHQFYNGLGIAFERRGEHARAEDAYRRALAIEPDFALALAGLGRLVIKLGRPAEAAELLRRAAALRPEYAPAHLGLGNALAMLGRTEEARGAYRAALRHDPGLSAAWTNLGNLSLEEGRVEEAIREFREALRLEPDDPVTRYNLGNALMQGGEIGGAIEEYRKVLEAKPDFAEAILNLGIASLRAGDREAAGRAAERLRSLDSAAAARLEEMLR